MPISLRSSITRNIPTVDFKTYAQGLKVTAIACAVVVAVASFFALPFRASLAVVVTAIHITASIALERHLKTITAPIAILLSTCLFPLLPTESFFQQFFAVSNIVVLSMNIENLKRNELLEV